MRRPLSLLTWAKNSMPKEQAATGAALLLFQATHDYPRGDISTTLQFDNSLLFNINSLEKSRKILD
jgi:hypothetical protein